MNPFRRNIGTLEREIRYAGLAIWNVGILIGFLLLTRESAWLKGSGAILASGTCCLLGIHLIRLGTNRDLLTNSISSKSTGLVEPIQFVQLGFLLLLFSIVSLATGAVYVYGTI